MDHAPVHCVARMNVCATMAGLPPSRAFCGAETYRKTAFIRNRFVQRYLSVNALTTPMDRVSWNVTRGLNRVLCSAAP